MEQDTLVKRPVSKQKVTRGRRRVRAFAAPLCAAACLTALFSGCGAGARQPAGLGRNAAALQESAPEQSSVAVRIGSMKGPTTIGLLRLMERAQEGETKGKYEFLTAATADGLLPLMVKGELDVALVPANVAAILYQRTEGGVRVIDVNTLGVLCLVSGDGAIGSMEALKGKTVYLTGKGTTPDYVLRYLLAANGLEEGDVRLEYKSEAAEVAALLSGNPDAVGLLPQPFATVACEQNGALRTVLDMTRQWDLVQGEEGGRLVTGVTVVREEFLEENPGAVAVFMEERKESADFVPGHVEETAALAVEAGLIADKAVAVKAVPACNVTFLAGEEMKKALSGYLEVLYGLDAASVGGALPEDGFYYIAEKDGG